MTLSESLYKLAERASEAEQKAQQAQKLAAEDVRGARVDLEKKVDGARMSADAQGKRLSENAKSSQDKLSKWWDQQQEAWNSHLAKVREHVEGKKVEIDVKKAEKRAEHAEADAEFAVDYAYAVLEEAEYSVLDAILARAEFEDLRKTV